MKIRMKAEHQQNNDFDKRKEKQEHKRFRDLRKNRNTQWQTMD